MKGTFIQWGLLTGAVLIITVFYFGRHILSGFFGLYRIVPINEAHIRVLQNATKIFSARTGASAYWYIPFITKLHKLPLCNLAIPVNDIKLNDKNMAKFVCDIMCFINITDIRLAVERLTRTQLGFDFAKLSEELRAIMESVGRTVTTKQTILDVYMNRQMLDQAITNEVQEVFPKWGIGLVDLELKDIKDATESSIIHDIERKVAAEIKRDADIRVATTNREAEVVKAQEEETFRKRQIEKEKAIGIADQQRVQDVAEAQALANQKGVDAARVNTVGMAEIAKEKIEQEAMAEKIKLTTEAEGRANKTLKEGTATADVVRITKMADAEGTMKLAEALKQYNDVAIGVKLLDIQKDVLIAKFKAFAEALSRANIQWIMSGDKPGKLFGLDLDAETGANLSQLMEMGVNVDMLKKLTSSRP
jgi:uncharacterized membrane protein YqiK